jgi:hypothetical protein
MSARPARPVTRALGVLLSLLTCASALVVVGSPAEAAVRTSRYLLAASGYGTRILSPTLGLQSAPTAYSVIGCGKATGITRTNSIAEEQTDQVRVGAVTTSQRSLLLNGSSIARSITTVASVTVGTPELGLKITGLRGISDARADRSGRLSASYDFTFSSISGLGVDLPYPLNRPVDVIVRQLTSGGPVVIPGLGELSLGSGGRSVTRTYARATGVGLQLLHYGPDQKKGTPDDSDVTLVRSYAFLSKAAPYGVFAGGAWGIDATALNGAVQVGRNPYTPLHCQGTGGTVRSQSLAGINVLGLNQLEVGAMTNRVYGRQGLPTRGITGWDESRVASLRLAGGKLDVSGVRAVAKVVRTSDNRFLRYWGQSIGTLKVDGELRRVPNPGQAFEIPGVARVEVPRRVLTANSVRVTALRITLLDGTAAGTVINLGNAQALGRYR